MLQILMLMLWKAPAAGEAFCPGINIKKTSPSLTTGLGTGFLGVEPPCASSGCSVRRCASMHLLVPVGYPVRGSVCHKYRCTSTTGNPRNWDIGLNKVFSSGHSWLSFTSRKNFSSAVRHFFFLYFKGSSITICSLFTSSPAESIINYSDLFYIVPHPACRSGSAK